MVSFSVINYLMSIEKFKHYNRQRGPNGYYHPIFFKRFDPPNMIRFPKGLKSIRSALLNLVELGSGTRQIGPISGYISTHQLHAFIFPPYDNDSKANQKMIKLTKILRRKVQSGPQENRVM